MAQTLAELKAQNAKLGDDTAQAEEIEETTEDFSDGLQQSQTQGQEETPSAEAQEQVTEEETVDVDEHLASDEEETEASDEQTEEEPSELWLQSQDSEQDQFTASDVGKLRRKLKGKLNESKDEIAHLKAEIEQLKTGGLPQQQAQQAQAQQPPNALKMPTLAEFDYDEGKYQQAMVNFNQQMIQQQIAQQSQQAQQQQAQQQAKQNLDSKVNAHYEKAQALVNDQVVTTEAYQSADQLIRQTLDNVIVGKGDDLADAVIANLVDLGDGSEKVWFHLGRNPASLNQLSQALMSDQTGNKAMAYLGMLHGKITTAPAKPLSKAPKPSAKLNGGQSASKASGSSAQRKYREAHKQGDSQKAWNIKQQAKRGGVDTSTW